MDKKFFTIFIIFIVACKKPYTCECNGYKKVIETTTINGNVTYDTISKTIFDSEIFREKGENEAFASCTNKKDFMINDLSNTSTEIVLDCQLR